MPLTVHRYPEPYNHDSAEFAFWHDMGHRMSIGSEAALFPSAASKAYVKAIEFDWMDWTRNQFTYVFRGVVNVDECSAGTYIFEVTASFSAAIIIDSKHVVINSKSKTYVPTTETGTFEFEAGRDYNFEVLPSVGRRGRACWGSGPPLPLNPTTRWSTRTCVSPPQPLCLAP